MRHENLDEHFLVSVPAPPETRDFPLALSPNPRVDSSRVYNKVNDASGTAGAIGRACPREPHTRRMNNSPRLSEGTFLYLLGVVIVATRPGRFWLGLGLAVTPLIVGALGPAPFGNRWRRA